ncbi:vascular endothelial growth factor A isoform X3 [Melanotaenia boesemani]|uniref:vascular endothelial growth factor A isoform X3 n=1 Tax=Melanotaenia boesemani TaxID=1250792 RepID=UPI001C0579F2|nr:vascular endothelial growth factor A isoform X3 [Melanotaenia boesemani]
MQGFIGISRLLLVLLLQLVPAQMLHLPEQRQSNMAFMEVLTRSMCRPMEQLVDVEHEFPEDVEYIYIPACVPLWRCSGCCADEKLECRPTTKRNITLQVMRILPLVSMQHVELTFVEHQECDCRLSQKPQNNKSSSKSVRNRPRRRKHEKPDVGCGKCQFPQNQIDLH